MVGKPLIIGICGEIGSGKDSVAEYLVQNKRFRQVSFAAKLKAVVADVLQLAPSCLDGTQAEKAAPIPKLGLVAPFFGQFRYADSPWPERVGLPWSGRFVLEFLGTDAFRAVYAPVWVEYLRTVVEGERAAYREWVGKGGDPNGAASHGGYIRHVVSDVRFVAPADSATPHALGCEFTMVRDLDGEMWRTTRTDAKQKTTGHVSDLSWRTAKVEVELSAKTGELQLLFNRAALALENMGVR